MSNADKTCKENWPPINKEQGHIWMVGKTCYAKAVLETIYLEYCLPQ